MSVKTKPSKTTKVPKFKSEAEEAEWWDRNPDFIADQVDQAAKQGRILRGLPGRGATRSVTIRLAMKDVETAQTLAAKMGLPYQTYIKTVLHQALERERNPPGR
jgi:predicted DNA binding CopG/RHH family protein